MDYLRGLTPIVKASFTSGTSLDLGCGNNPKNPFRLSHLYGIDIKVDQTNSSYCLASDLAIQHIPFPNQAFDAITAYDFIEHIPRLVYAPAQRFSFILLMGEIYRCLKPGGRFVSVTPAYPNPEAFQDPTHVNIITEETFPKYFCSPYNWASLYGFETPFELIDQAWVSDGKLSTILRRPHTRHAPTVA